MVGRSKNPGGVGYVGPVSPDALQVIATAWAMGGFSVSSNYARQYSAEVALAASCGWISTVALDGLTHDRTWRITFEGLSLLRSTENA